MRVYYQDNNNITIPMVYGMVWCGVEHPRYSLIYAEKLLGCFLYPPQILRKERCVVEIIVGIVRGEGLKWAPSRDWSRGWKYE